MYARVLYIDLDIHHGKLAYVIIVIYQQVRGEVCGKRIKMHPVYLFLLKHNFQETESKRPSIRPIEF